MKEMCEQDMLFTADSTYMTILPDLQLKARAQADLTMRKPI